MRIDLSSTRLAFVLIALLLAHIFLSAIIPQRGLTEGQIFDLQHRLGDSYRVIEALRLDEIYTAPPFYALLGLLGLNLLVGNVKRFRQVYRVERTLLRARYLGSIIFHLALLLVLGGAIFNYLYKFQGVFALTEGQTAADGPSGYFRTFEGPLYRAQPERFRLRVDSIDSDYQVEETTTKMAEVTLAPTDASEELQASILVNHPLLWENLEFHLGALVGYSPEIQLADSTGAISFRSFVRVAVSEHEDAERHADFLELTDDTTLRIEVLESDQAPRLSIELEQAGRPSHAAELGVGESTVIGESFVSIPRLRRWVFIEVRRNPYLHLVFIGFWSALAGLSVTLVPRVWNPRKG